MAPIPAESLAILPSYPQMIGGALARRQRHASLGRCGARLAHDARSIAGRSRRFPQTARPRASWASTATLTQSRYDQLSAGMSKTVDDFNNAATAASQAAQLFNMARSRQLSVRITLFGSGNLAADLLDAALRAAAALRQRPVVDYRTMLRGGLTPGDVTAATIIAADIKSTPEASSPKQRARARRS